MATAAKATASARFTGSKPTFVQNTQDTHKSPLNKTACEQVSTDHWVNSSRAAAELHLNDNASFKLKLHTTSKQRCLVHV